MGPELVKSLLVSKEPVCFGFGSRTVAALAIDCWYYYCPSAPFSFGLGVLRIGMGWQRIASIVVEPARRPTPSAFTHYHLPWPTTSSWAPQVASAKS